VKLSELIEELERIRNKHGDVPVLVQTLSHSWAPEPEVREAHASKAKFVLLNP